MIFSIIIFAPEEFRTFIWDYFICALNKLLRSFSIGNLLEITKIKYFSESSIGIIASNWYRAYRYMIAFLLDWYSILIFGVYSSEILCPNPSTDMA